jgi:hypothetical protein
VSRDDEAKPLLSPLIPVYKLTRPRSFILPASSFVNTISFIGSIPQHGHELSSLPQRGAHLRLLQLPHTFSDHPFYDLTSKPSLGCHGHDPHTSSRRSTDSMVGRISSTKCKFGTFLDATRFSVLPRSVNIIEGEPSDRPMTTGNHTVRDIYCCKCHTTLGWKYASAHIIFSGIIV